MFSGRTTTTISSPAHGPLDYNSLRPSFATLAPLFGLTMISLIPIGVGALFVYWSVPLATGLQLISAVVGGRLSAQQVKDIAATRAQILKLHKTQKPSKR